MGLRLRNALKNLQLMNVCMVFFHVWLKQTGLKIKTFTCIVNQDVYWKSILFKISKQSENKVLLKALLEQTVPQ